MSRYVFVRKVGNTPAGTIREMDDHDPAVRYGYAEKTTAKETEAEPEDNASVFDAASATVPELRAELKRRGQDSTGKQAELRERLASDPHHHGNEGGEEPGEGVPPEEAVNPDLTDLDGHDTIVTEDHFAGEANTDDPGIKIASTVDFDGESDPGQDVPDPSPEPAPQQTAAEDDSDF